MSTSIILLDRSFRANDVDTLILEACFYPCAAAWGWCGIGCWCGWNNYLRNMVPLSTLQTQSFHFSDVIVYGVEIPGTDGRAGMAAISNESNSTDMGKVSEAVLSLPSYARPIFVRLIRDTMKHLTGQGAFLTIATAVK